ANILEKNFRSADTVIRYGGDEFLVMMPQTDGGVEKTITRLKKRLSKWNKRSSLLDFPLTLAWGISYWSPHQDKDVEEAIKEADEKMYENKKSTSLF
ncbi:diguanylate cyclase, partial [bacterium]|nr:diguanylate cyclase [bacterium]